MEDLADAHIASLERLLDGGDSFQANLGTGVGATVMQVIEAIGRVTGKTPPYETAPRRFGDAPGLYADPSRARDMLRIRSPKHRTSTRS